MAGPTDEELSKQRETTKKLKRCLQNKLTRKKCEKPTSYKTVHLDEHVENGKVVRRWTYTTACPVGEKQSGREKEQKSETETEISICSRRQHKDRNGHSREAGSPEARNRKQKRVQEMELLEIENECRRRQSGSSDQNDKAEKCDVSVSRGSTGPAKIPLAPDHPLPSAHSLIPHDNKATVKVPPIAGDAGPPPVDTPLPPILSAARRNNTVCLQLKTAMAQRPAMRIFDAKTCCVGGRAVSQQTTCIPEDYYTAKAHLTQTTVKETSPQTRPSTRYAATARVGSRKIHSKESLISKKSVDVVPLPADNAKSAERITTDYKKGQKDSKESSPEKTKSPRQLETDKVPPTKPRPWGQLTATQMDVVFRMMAELNASGVLAQRVDEVNSVVGVDSEYSVSSCGEKQTPEWMALSEKARREPAICKQVTAATDALNAAAHSLKTYMRIGGSATECEPHLATIQKMKKALDKM